MAQFPLFFIVCSLLLKKLFEVLIKIGDHLIQVHCCNIEKMVAEESGPCNRGCQIDRFDFFWCHRTVGVFDWAFRSSQFSRKALFL